MAYLEDTSSQHLTASKIRNIQQAPLPTNKIELQAFLGLLNFYNVFLLHKVSVAEPLHGLLDKKTLWSRGSRDTDTLNAVKKLLSSDSVLVVQYNVVQFNELRPLVLACDTSPFGISARLSHSFPDGGEAPIAYYSQTYRNCSSKSSLPCMLATQALSK